MTTKDQSKIIVILGAAVVCSLLAALIGLWAAARKQVVVIAATEQGSFIQQVPTSKPYLNESRVQGFVEECLRRSFGHDFQNYQVSVTEALTCYTPKAGELFAAALDPLLENEVKRRRMVMSPVIVTPPVVVKAGPGGGGAFTWIVQARVKLVLEGTKERVSPTTYRVECHVTRVPLDENPRGILLSYIALRPDGGA